MGLRAQRSMGTAQRLVRLDGMRDMFDVVTRKGDHIYAPITVLEAVLLQIAVSTSGQTGDFARD